MHHPDEKIGLFIDGANNHAAARALDFKMDYTALRAKFSGARLVRALYFTPLAVGGEHSPVKPLVDWLGYNGYSVVTKPPREYTDRDGKKRSRTTMVPEMIVAMLAAADYLDHIFVFSGDADLVAGVEAVKQKGVRVTLVSSLRSDPPVAADDLRRAADAFIELDDWGDEIGEPYEAPARTSRTSRDGRRRDYDDEDEDGDAY